MRVIRLEPLRKQLADMWWKALPKNSGMTTFMNGKLVSSLRADIIEEILKVIENQEKIEVEEYRTAFRTALSPILEADGYADGELVYDTWYCPGCDSAFEAESERYGYCPNCGQEIDWSESNDKS